MNSLIIDGHSHVTLPVEKHLSLMDEAGIDKTILFRTSIHPELQSNEEGIKKEMQKLMNILSGDTKVVRKYSNVANKELFDAVEKYPDRFYCFGIVPLDMDIPDMIEEIR